MVPNTLPDFFLYLRYGKMQPFFHLAVYMIYIPLVLMPLAPCCQFLKCLIAISRSITVSESFIVLMISVTIVSIKDLGLMRLV